MKARGSSEPRRVLVIDDDPVVRRLCLTTFGDRHDLVADGAASLALALPRLGGCAGAVVALDGDAVPIETIRAAGFTGPVIAASRSGSVSLAVAAMRAGADDVVVKPFAPADLVRRLTTLLAVAQAPASRPAGHGAAAPERSFEGFIGASSAMREVFDQIVRIAPSKAPVFVTGESGTGKEVTAEAIHARSPGAGGPFIALNCGAIPKDLMESEIFGHVRGAFTGAHEDRPGAAELADGGTLFLDEICEMDLGLQSKLLRFIQTGELKRVGDGRTRSVDVRFVCATNRDPAVEVAIGRFREDLYYRLHVLPIHLPPLRARGEDVILLARAFLARFAAEEGKSFAGFAPDAERLIAVCDWPGNVRQLQNVIRRVVVLHDGVRVEAEMLALPIVASGSPLVRQPKPDADVVEPFAVQEQRIIERALKACDGNIPKAAAALGIAPSTIYRKRQSWAAVH
ncbi:sigma-54-dependent transcriptional regulator [Blastochloris viridis]|nr:sigma-54 dependent transcriptional regulator [Blastochloris viridis]